MGGGAGRGRRRLTIVVRRMRRMSMVGRRRMWGLFEIPVTLPQYRRGRRASHGRACSLRDTGGEVSNRYKICQTIPLARINKLEVGLTITKPLAGKTTLQKQGHTTGARNITSHGLREYGVKILRSPACYRLENISGPTMCGIQTETCR